MPRKQKLKDSPPAFYTAGKQKRAAGAGDALRAWSPNEIPTSLHRLTPRPRRIHAKQSPFSSVLARKRSAVASCPPVDKDDHEGRATALPPSAFSAAEQRCLPQALISKPARDVNGAGGCRPGDFSTGCAFRPTAEHGVCGCGLSEMTNWRNRCQFSFACETEIKDPGVRSPHAWKHGRGKSRWRPPQARSAPEVGSRPTYHGHLVSPHMGQQDAQGRQDRASYSILRDLWRRLVLEAGSAHRRGLSARVWARAAMFYEYISVAPPARQAISSY